MKEKKDITIPLMIHGFVISVIIFTTIALIINGKVLSDSHIPVLVLGFMGAMGHLTVIIAVINHKKEIRELKSER